MILIFSIFRFMKSFVKDQRFYNWLILISFDRLIKLDKQIAIG